MKIGVFDSGYGGLTILEKIRERLPGYDYIYLGDNARAPYGTRSFQVIYEYTLEAVRYLQHEGCRLIILACNTASAKALRTIQQHDIDPDKLRVLGVIRPTVEVVPSLTRNGHIGIVATPGTVSSESYVIELQHQMSNYRTASADRSRLCRDKNCQLSITQQSCPLWVPLIEAGEHDSEGADWFVKKYLDELLRRDPLIDTLVLGCTHYPLLLPKIEAYLHREPRTENRAPILHTFTNSHKNVSSSKPITERRQGNAVSTAVGAITLVSQGAIVADSLADYLHRHPEIACDCSRGGTCRYLTTESAERFQESARIFMRMPLTAETITLGV